MDHFTYERIEQAINAAERTRAWVARKALIPPTTFGRKMDGVGDFTLAELARIARALGVEPYTLLPVEFLAVV